MRVTKREAQAPGFSRGEDAKLMTDMILGSVAMAVLKDDWDWAAYLDTLRWDVIDEAGNRIPLVVDVRVFPDRGQVEGITLLVHSVYVRPFDVIVPCLPDNADGISRVLSSLLGKVVDGCRDSGYDNPKGAAVSTGDGLVGLALIE